MKKGLLFSLMATFLAGIGFGGVSLADDCTPENHEAKIGETCYAKFSDAASAYNGVEIELLKDITTKYKLTTNGQSIRVKKQGYAIQIYTTNRAGFVEESIGNGISTYTLTICDNTDVAIVNQVCYSDISQAITAANGGVVNLIGLNYPTYTMSPSQIVNIKAYNGYYRSVITMIAPVGQYYVNESTTDKGTTSEITTYTLNTCGEDSVAAFSGVCYSDISQAIIAASGDVVSLIKDSTYTMPESVAKIKVKKDNREFTVNTSEGYVVESAVSAGVTTYTQKKLSDQLIEIISPAGNTTYSTSFSLTQGDGYVVKLLKDYTTTSAPNVSSSMATQGNVVLDLNGYTLNVNTSISTNYCILVGRNRTLTIKNGTINMAPTTTSKSNGFALKNTATLNIGADVIINAEGVSVVSIFNTATLNTSGTLRANDDFTIAGNGSDGNGGYTINILGGQLESTNASVVYHPNEGTLNINGGTLKSNSIGIVTRAGTTTISKDVVFDVSGEGNTTIGDEKNIHLPKGNAVVMDVAANYPGSTSATFSVNNAALGNAYVVVGTKDDYNGYDVSIRNGENVVPLLLTKDGTSAKITEPEAIEGYQWYNVVDENNKYVFNFSQIITGDTVIESIINQYTVKFDANAEGVGNPVDQTINHGAIASEPEVLNTGNILLGRYLNDNKFDFTTPITGDITLIGKWEAMTDSGGEVELPEDDTFTGVILKPAEPVLSESEEINITELVASNNSTAEMEGVVELKVYSDYDGDGRVDVGDGDKLLTGKVNFTTPKVVRIPVNTTGDVLIKVRHNTETTFSTNGLTTSGTATCSNGVATPVYTGTPITPNGGYVEIYTCSASTFVAYTEKANQSSSSTSGGGRVGGGGGGSSSSYSCKSLPANAVVNNTSKPKKDTNYSYSTDTDAVCTFQCKAGYTRNEKNEKCEKSSETLTDTDKEGTEKVDTTDTSDTAFEDLRKVLDDGYTVEFHNAYNFAFKNGITTMPNIQAADMNSPLTRIAMAKMLSQYAINVLGKTPDTTKTILFPDVSAELDAQYNNGVTLAYQLGIMGVNIENFRPDDLVTRAEFVTALSRMLFGLADGENLYYETHMQKLLDENIITVDNPNMHELRGYVMIMLMRSVKNN